MSEIILYQTSDNQMQVEVHFKGATEWLNQKQRANLLDKDSDAIGLHLKNIYSEEELDENSTTEFFSAIQTEGKRQVKRRLKFYNLDAILSVGYHVSSKKGTQFHQWVAQHLKEHLVQGSTINQRRLDELQQTVYCLFKNLLKKIRI